MQVGATCASPAPPGRQAAARATRVQASCARPCLFMAQLQHEFSQVAAALVQPLCSPYAAPVHNDLACLLLRTQGVCWLSCTATGHGRHSLTRGRVSAEQGGWVRLLFRMQQPGLRALGIAVRAQGHCSRGFAVRHCGGALQSGRRGIVAGALQRGIAAVHCSQGTGAQGNAAGAACLRAHTHNVRHRRTLLVCCRRLRRRWCRTCSGGTLMLWIGCHRKCCSPSRHTCLLPQQLLWLRQQQVRPR